MTEDERYVLDRRVKDGLVKQAYVSAGFAKPTLNGSPSEPDRNAMKARLLELISSRIVADKEHVSENSWTVSELVNVLFPSAPGSDGTPIERLSLNQQTARDELKRHVSDALKATKDGWVQRRLTGNFVLCHGLVTRDGNEVAGVYVTDDDDVRIRDNLKKALDRYVNASVGLRQQTDMLVERGLPPARVYDELISARARIVSALTYPGMPELVPVENGRKGRKAEEHA
jgi:hypothetical protein